MSKKNNSTLTIFITVVLTLISFTMTVALLTQLDIFTIEINLTNSKKTQKIKKNNNVIKIQNYLNQKRFIYLNKACSDVLKENRQNIPALYWRGWSFLAFGDLNKAKKDFSEITTINPNYAKAYISLATINYLNKKFDTGEKNFKKAMSLTTDKREKAIFSTIHSHFLNYFKDESIQSNMEANRALSLTKEFQNSPEVDIAFNSFRNKILVKNLKSKYVRNASSMVSKPRTDGGRYIGQTVQGKMNGQGIYVWSNGNFYMGQFKNDKMTGYGTYYYVDGRKYQGNFFNGMMHGYGVFKCPDGRIYKGQFIGNKMNGRGTFYFSDGSVYTGELHDNKMEGKGILKFKTGVMYKGTFINDKINGEGSIYKNGKWKKATFKNDQIIK